MNKPNRQYEPLPIQKIEKTSSFEQIFGRSWGEYTKKEKQARWEKALSFPGGEEIKDYYSNVEVCTDCIHYCRGWCDLQDLPAGVNPIITFRSGYLGLACMGLGYESKEQIEIEWDKE